MVEPPVASVTKRPAVGCALPYANSSMLSPSWIVVASTVVVSPCTKRSPAIVTLLPNEAEFAVNVPAIVTSSASANVGFRPFAMFCAEPSVTTIWFVVPLKVAVVLPSIAVPAVLLYSTSIVLSTPLSTIPVPATSAFKLAALTHHHL